MNLVQKSPEVFVAMGPIATIGTEEIALLKAAVSKSPNGRVRINAHANGDDRLHEMFIAIRPDSYIRPHKHPNKTESFHLVYGEVDIVVFEDDGRIRQVVPLGAGDPARAFYYRMSKPFFHTLVIHSDLLVVHEITNGPFQPSETVFASFAPEDSNESAAAAYQVALAEKIVGMGSA
jgi:cupin fold WbuC family metalloprotein